MASWWQSNRCSSVFLFLLVFVVSIPYPVVAGDLLLPTSPAVITHIDKQHSSTSWSAANIVDDNPSTRWLSNRRDNDLIFAFDPAYAERCFGRFTIENYGSSRSVEQFMLLRSADSGLATDIGTTGWQPLISDPSPTGLINHLHWGQGGRLTAVDREHSSTTWAGAHINNGNLGDYWLSNKGNNILEFAFDPDWDGSTGGAVNVKQLKLHNYGSNRSIQWFQVEVSENGVDWSKLEVPGTGAGDANYNFLSSHEGGILDIVNREHSSTTWAGSNIHDGSAQSIWLSSRANNNLDFSFNPNATGGTGLAGDTGDYFKLEKFSLENYGSNRSVKQFQLLVQQTGSSEWILLPVPGSTTNQPNFNFLLSHEGGQLDLVNREHSSTTWAGANVHDGSSQTIWLSSQTNNNLDFSFDPNDSGDTGLEGDADDYFTLEKIVLENYGSNRSVKQFQVFVQQAGDSTWVALPVPGSTSDQDDFNFLLSHEGAALTAINKQHSGTTWAAANIHDGSPQSIWLSSSTNNTLDFDFDVDGSGTSAEATDRFKIEKFTLQNYGSSRSVKNFQIEVKTESNGDWTKLEVPGTDTGTANFNFLSLHEGAGLTFIDRQHNTSSWAAQNIFDGNYGSSWLSSVQGNTLEFDFNPNLDAVRGDTINFSKMKMRNYGSNWSVATFELDVQVPGGGWQAVPAPGGGTAFSAVQSSAEQEWSIALQANVTGFRIRTLTNHGGTYTGIRELELLGNSTGPIHTFVANQSSTEQQFLLDGSDQPDKVTAVRFRSISNYGDTYTGVRELKILGKSITRSHTFEALQSSAAQIYELDLGDRPTDVVAVRLQTISNFGDTYTGLRELKLLGQSVARNHTFEALQTSVAQVFELDPSDQPTNVVAVRLQTIENYGDTYTGIRELQLIGQAVAASHTFVAAQASTEQIFTLDSDDTVSNIVAARLRTIRNYGDTYTGAREFQLLGDAVGPLYLFNAQQSSVLQGWDFPVANGKLFRFHTFNNYGDTYTGVTEIGLESSSACYPDPVGAWHLDEMTWGLVTDASGNGLHGSAHNDVGTDDETPAIAGDVGTCRYGVFDGSDDYLSIPHSDLLNGTNSLTYMAWINPQSWTGIRQIMDKSIHGGSSGRAQMGLFSQSGGLKGRAETAGGRITVETPSPSLNSWTHVALVFDGTKLQLYINGALADEESFTVTTLIANSDPFQIGRRTLSNQYYFSGSIDEVRVYSEALTDSQISAIMNLTHPCSANIDDNAMGFNCVVTGGDDLTGRLYTQVVGQAFVVDVAALKDADANGSPDGRATEYAFNADREVTIELVDASSGASCTEYSALSPTVSQNLIFSAADEGRKSAAEMTVSKAYRELRCRVTDATQVVPVVGCSTDDFAIRPSQFDLQIPILSNGSSSGTPIQAAGSAFTLQATTSTAGYDGTPELDSSKLEAHSGATRTGALAGVFAAADPVDGSAEGSNFSYDEVGNFRLQNHGLLDTSFTAIDQPEDCVDSFSNIPDGAGKVGCKFSSSGNSAWVGRFTPDHFTVDIDNNGAFANTCIIGSFSYSGQPITFVAGQLPTAIITAWNALSTPTITQNYSGEYRKLEYTDIVMPDVTSDASQMGVDGTTSVTLSWDMPTIPDLVGQGDGTLLFNLTDDTFTYGRDINDQVAAFTSAIELEISSVTDSDGVTATGMPKSFQPTGVPIRYGRLTLTNAHGSELQSLNIPMQVEYYNGANIGFVLNTEDQCTTDISLALADLDNSDGLTVSDGGDKETAIYASASIAGGYAASDLSDGGLLFFQPAAGGLFNLNLQAPGENNRGSAEVQVTGPDWLKFRWSGSGMTDPKAKATFGIYKRSNTAILYMREATGQ